jgi:oligopeptide/dipeptide ABC transporter ATP-binding protein
VHSGQSDSSAARSVPLLAVERVAKRFPVRRGVFGRLQGYVHAVDGVSFDLWPRETLGIVGESGCGKSTLARMIVRLVDPSEGAIRFSGEDITALPPTEMRRFRRNIQFIFQDPYASLNPRLKAGDIVAEPLENYDRESKESRAERVAELFGKVSLGLDQMRKFPHEFSGGQRQRLGIARALALNPSVIVADEPVSALDVSVQAQIINLMMDLQVEFGLSYLFIAHDLAVVQHISHRVAVLYLGRIVESADRSALFTSPLHPYTEALLEAAPAPNPAMRRRKAVVAGEVPSPIRPPPGCHFHPRCPLAEERCRIEVPALVEARPGHFAACHVRAPADARTVGSVPRVVTGESR